MSFDLTTQPWIPVTVQGVRAEVSVRDALLQAHEIDGLAVDDPLQAVAVLRQVLLPVVLHAFGVPRDIDGWHDRHTAGAFPPEVVTAYLDEYAARFDLFDPAQPFAQVADLHAANGETKPVSLLLPQLASGNNVPLFSARTDADPPALTPAEAARAVLSAHCWDTAAIKTGAVGDPKMKSGKTAGNPTGPLGQLGVVIPLGGSLFETLMLSVPVLRQGLPLDDRPQWATEEPQCPTWASRSPHGLLDLLTWQSRRIRLVPEKNDGEIRIRRVVLCAGDRIQTLPHDVEPHTAWRLADRRKPDEPPRPDRHQPDRSPWRGLAAMIATRRPTSEGKAAPLAMQQVAALRQEGVLPEDFPLRALVVGVSYGNQAAVIEDVVSDTIPLPVLALLDTDDTTDDTTEGNEVRATLLEVVDQAEALRRAANGLDDDLHAALGATKVPWDRGQKLGELLVNAFTPTVRRLLAGLQRHPDDADRAAAAWRTVARRTAEQIAAPALDAVPATAFLGRKITKTHHARLATADAAFRHQLNTILGPAEALVTTSGSGGNP
ncbi:type I-E CRISPR-associated protein Cse1/CasA [Pseudonocardia sp. CA-107938]|uniref:type I-E CRISPR-associated protein Cse1/CasA n=1 Tax=Pseudonocardia sp. CA-107938 TaxID=3240021 RepID=UPI003D8C7CBB